jgi:glycosyltransferase involved in cell wall biosynthesis
MNSISILIPTYNRATKIARLLKNIENVVKNIHFAGIIDVIVSDNASTDNTQEIVTSFKTDRYRLRYYRQSVNLGFDGNIRFLYEKATSDYVWYFADDDIMHNDALNKIMGGVQKYQPDVLLFSFEQPPGSKHRIYNYEHEYEVVDNPKEIVELVFRNTKISVYVMKRTTLNEEQINELKPFYNNGFYFVDLAYTLLNKSNAKLCVISEPLAESDDDYVKFDYTPGTFANMYKIFMHPYAMKYCPEYMEYWKDRSYYHEIKMLFGIKMGSIIVKDMSIYDKGIKDMWIRYGALIKSPKDAALLLIMKMKLVKLYKWLRKIFKYIA